MTDKQLADDVRKAAEERAIGARMTARAAIEQAADLIEAMEHALKANIFGSEWRGVFQEVDAFTRRLRDEAEEQPR